MIWRDHVLTTVCLYYFTRCITSSSLVYFENPPHHEFAAYCIAEENLIKCPFGYTSMLFDTAPNSKRAVERTGNLVWYKERVSRRDSRVPLRQLTDLRRTTLAILHASKIPKAWYKTLQRSLPNSGKRKISAYLQAKTKQAIFMQSEHLWLMIPFPSPAGLFYQSRLLA